MTENLIKCPQCKEMIAKGAKKCKHCNADLRSWFARHPIRTLIIGLFFLFSFFQAHQESKPEYKAEQQAQEVAKNTKLQENKQKLTQIEITKSEIKDEYGFPFLKLTVKNNTGRDIDGLKFKASFQNNFKETVRASISGDEFFDGIVQEVLKNRATANYKRQLSLYDNATIIKTLELREVHFTDGETVTLDL